MSKSLGNSPDPLALIEKFGADGVRCGLLLSASAGNDILFDEELCNQGKAFSNKIWNAFRLIRGWEIAEIPQPQHAKITINWFENKFQQIVSQINKDFEKYRISEALMAIYKLIWDDFCSWFLEIIKPNYGQPIDKTTFDSTISILENNLKLLHPFMPFLTEEIWQHISKRTPENALIISEYPRENSFDTEIIADFEFTTQIISGIRTIRKEKNISFKDTIDLKIINHEKTSDKFDSVVKKLGNIKNLEYSSQNTEESLTFRIKSNEYFVPISGNMDVATEIVKLKAELDYCKGFLVSVEKKLSNEKFVSSAPEQVIANERKKQTDTLAKITTLEQRIANLK